MNDSLLTNRIVHFRVWHNFEKKWLKPEDFVINGHGVLYGNVLGNGKLGCIHNNPDYNISFSTGRLDINKKEIFEGDYIKDLGYVSYEDGFWGIQILFDLHRFSFADIDVDTMQIIGDVYEKPELFWESENDKESVATS